MAKYMGPPPLPTVPPLPWNRVRLTPNSLHTCMLHCSSATDTLAHTHVLTAEERSLLRSGHC